MSRRSLDQIIDLHPNGIRMPLLNVLAPYCSRAVASGLAVVMACAVPTNVRAHGDLDLRIAVMSVELRTAPTASLYLQRGELHHEHGDFTAALADYDRAAKLDPHLDAVSFCRARTLFKAGQ